MSSRNQRSKFAKSKNSVEEKPNRSDFETMVIAQLNEIITRIGAIEKKMANPTHERSTFSRDNSTVITRLGMDDQVELNKLGLPVVSLETIDEFEANLENTEFIRKIVSCILSMEKIICLILTQISIKVIH